MRTYVRVLGYAKYAVIVLIPTVVIVSNWMTSILDPEKCPVGLVCK